ncbi:MAG TPA: amino acid adenylation domain-containing protein [Thermoanaerobaculia bacterium]|jgi:amino acid adenylation domain-containing protein/non-ribosomal peptide synthase protein (TIGR01720 family)|nr:amino acid adenylation domain-containing protein [Thermoanaerobaculia bacterium]
MSKKSNVEDLYPLSPLQQGLLFHSLFAPESGAYVEQLVFPLLEEEAGTDIALLRQAFQQLVDLHPVLRSAFAWERRDEPLQVVVRKARVPQESLDWRDLGASEAEARLAAFLEKDRREGFDLSRPPLLRTTCVRLPGERTLLVFTYHHILLDGWSVALVFQDLFALYGALRSGEEPLLELRLPFRAYIDWLAGRDLADAEVFWRRTLAGFEAPTPLPAADRAAGGGALIETETAGQLIRQDLTASLRLFAQKRHLTLNTLLQAAWALLLSRYGGVEDVVFGATALGRPDDLPGVHGMIGLLINTLPVRISLPPSKPVLGWLGSLQSEAFARRHFEFSPLSEVQKWSAVPRGTSLFESLLDFEVLPRGSGRGALPHSFAEKTHFPLTLDVVDLGDLTLALAFDRHRFDRAGILRLAAGFVALLEGLAAARPETRLSDLSLLGGGERHQLTVEWNEPWPEDLGGGWAPGLFERRAAEHPEAIALVCGGDRLGYREANRRANRLARRLLAAGAGPGATIAVCAERSLEMVLALLAVHKTGGAYLPLDPELPLDRLEFLLADAGASLLLAQEHLLERLPGDGPAVIPLDSRGASAPADDENPSLPIHGESLAYVIYTSGSTGRPKGVAVTHANLLRLFQVSQPRFGFGAGDVWTLFHSYAFDFSVWEIWGALLYGGRLVIVPQAVSRSPEDFYRLLVDEGVTVLNQTPSAFRQLIRAEEVAGASPDLALRWVIFGGEALELAALRSWFACHGDRRPRLVNMYGITETTVHVTWRGIGAAEAEAVAGSVIGRPLGDLAVHLLGSAGELLPIGAPGEICVGGRGLARGYLGRPDLTASRFVPDPFAQVPGARLYRSGDLARRLPDGGLEYLGRIDHQVKVRGFRIELGEIEAALARQPTVAEAAVTVRGDAQGNSQLVAYVVPRGPAAPATTSLRKELGRVLPGYMIPAVYVLLETLPLTANGKVDRKALPAPSGERPELAAAFVAPLSGLEQRIAAIWSGVLGIDRVGLDDSFFALGGDSIRGIQVLAQSRREGIELTLQQLFSLETVGRLAAALEGGTASAVAESAPREPFFLVSAEERARLPESAEDAYPVTMLQAGMLFHGEYAAGEGMYEDVFSYHLHLVLDTDCLRQAVHGLGIRHAVLRTGFDLTGSSRPLQWVSREVEIPVVEEDLSPLPVDEQEKWIETAMAAERCRGFDWNRPPLLRFLVHRRAAGRFQLTVACHHAVLDGWSLATLLSELFQDYTGLLRGQRVEIVAPAVAFRDAVALESAALESAATRSYWRGKLAGAPRLALPRWPGRGGEETASRQSVVPPELFVRLDEVTRQARVPLKSLVLAVHSRVMGLWGGQTDVVTGLVSSGRPESEGGEKVLGLFLNTLPLRLGLTGGSWLDLIKAAFAAEAESLPHRRYPLAQIQRDLGGDPLFETTVNFMHFHVYEDGVSAQLELLGRKSLERNNFTLAVNFWVEPGGRQAFLMLDSGGLGGAQVAVIADTYLRALESIARDPHSRYDTAPLLAEPEAHRLLREANDTRSAAGGLAVHHLIEAQAAGRPEVPAVVCGAERLSYAQLDRLANRLAWRLAEAGVAPGSLVGVCLERSARLVAALLGVLKAAAAYVPLDPSHPAERLAMIREDAHLSCVLTEDRLEALLAGAHPRESAPPERSTPLDALAYVMFTSGSTGRPKGVQVSHGALANFLESMRARPGIGPEDRLAAVTTLSFDIAGLELYLPLIAGACVIVVAREVAADGERLRGLLEESGATMLQATPVTWHLLLEAGWRGGAKFRALCGGEALAPQLAERLLAACGEVWNMYGPTETTIWSSVEQVHRGGEGTGPTGAVPLGRPIANTELYALDRFLAPVPPLSAGELYIGGEGLSWGYLHRPELTAERFVPDLFSGRPGARLYRTGDQVRLLPDGRVEYLGRLDHQVKLRGFRIELGEIEAALESHPAVARAVAQVREDRPGDRRLVAYLVPRPEPEPYLADLRAHVQSRVPEYMLPASWVLLAELPLTPNGKVDRKALPAPEPEATVKTVAARTPVEELLAQIWAETLGRDTVGVHDRFLDLGGHSLLAMQVLARVRQAFRLDLPLRSLFEEPTVAGMAHRIEAARAEGAVELPPLVPVARGGEPVLSFAQERLWFLDQLAPGTSAYNIPGSLRFSGEIEPVALERALDEIRSRHEILRTRYGAVEGRAVVRVRPPQSHALPLVDLGGLPEAPREAELGRLTREEARRPFDLDRDELLRACLVRFAAPDHALLLTVHHIVSDGPSMALLNRELRRLYEAFAAGEPSPLEPLPLQCLDHAAWQRSWMRAEVLEDELGFWREHLQRAPRVLNLPADRPWPAVQSFRGSGVPFIVDRRLAERLRRVARQAGVTPFMVLVAGFVTLLARSTGEWDVPLGTPVSGRTHVELQELIGLFANTLVLRPEVAGSLSFHDLLGKVREEVLAVHAHQMLPFERLVDALVPERSLQHSPLFQAALAYEKASGEDESAGLQPLRVASETAKFELSLSFVERPGELNGYLEYSTGLFDAVTAERLAARLQCLLRSAAEQPETALAEIPWLSEGERQQLLTEWNDTPDTSDSATLVSLLFARQAARTPGAVALLSAGRQLTFGEIEHRSNQLARHLRRLGAGREVRIGLAVERSLELVTGLLAIFKTGGVFVPLDPAYPEARLRFIAEDSAASLLVAGPGLAGRFAAPGARVVDLDRDAVAIDRESGEALEGLEDVQPGDAAYMIYTSGSTGHPKGVVVEHGSLAHFLAVCRREMGWTTGDSMPCVAPFSFDIFLFELLNPLLGGAAVMLVASRPALDVEGLLTALEEATHFHAVPALMQQVVEAVEREGRRCTRLRSLFVGGDRVPGDLLAALRRMFPRARVRVLYGPTEATVICAGFTVPAEGAVARTMIGRPLPGAAVRVCDEHLSPVPLGVAGEVCIGGPGVSRGYWNRAELTAERFVEIGGQRFYRSGDLGRYMPDGNIEFLGRQDHQVKVRGFRIDCGEIEAALRGYGAVREAVVEAEEHGGDRRLVAYVVPAAPAPSVAELRAHLETILPEHMVPAVFVALESFPLSANGKVDRQALRRASRVCSAEAESYVAPRTPVEERLAQIWAEVLGLEKVGVEDSFFHLGGDSILGIRVVAKAREAGLGLTPRHIFEHRTITELAGACGAVASRLGQEPVVGDVRLTPIQRDFFAQDPPSPHHFNQAVLFESRLRLDPAGFTAAVAALLEHHDALRLCFHLEGTAWRQVNAAPGGPVPFTVFDLSTLSPEQQTGALEIASAALQASLDLAQGPLLRVAHFDFGPDRPGRLLFLAHHLVIDGVSWRVLLEDLETAYRRACGEAVDLPAKTLSYQRWAEALHERSRAAEVHAEAPFWLAQARRELAGLPCDLVGENTRASARTLEVELDAAETVALLRDTPRAYQTRPDEVLLTALVLALTGGRRGATLRVDLEGHGREDLGEEVDVSRTVGWFTALYPLVLQVEDPAPGEALKSTKEQVRTVPGRGLGHGLLRHLSDGPVRAELERAPAAEVVFNYLGQLSQVEQASALFVPAREPVGPLEAAAGLRRHVLEINAAVTAGRLRIAWTWSASLHRRETVERWAGALLRALRDLVAHCRSVESPEHTASDFPLAALDADSLGRLALLVDEIDSEVSL